MPWVDVCIAKANVYAKYGYDLIAQGNSSYTQVTPGKYSFFIVHNNNNDIQFLYQDVSIFLLLFPFHLYIYIYTHTHLNMVGELTNWNIGIKTSKMILI